MAEVQTLRKGNIYEEDGQLWRVLEFQHIKVARGGATIRLKLRNVRTESTVEKTYSNGTRVNDVELDKADVQYLYNDGQFYHFMNTETFEQLALGPDVMEDVKDFLLENEIISLESYDGEPLSLKLPTAVDLRVVWAEAAIAGDTANSPTKQVELETGLRAQVPMFVQEGDVIRVDTRDGSYVTRVKQ
ncbi:MAG: elongation factor P [Caldilinea sp.]|nr:elongation factor P [Caldilinea sp.]MCB0059272.1 elongation factor P [Caldilineaceae bacterium]MCO5209833.1 elongation factor P [Caldilinea sp.]HRW45938.1 elongation factor P [Caldilinea sp.]